MKKVTMEPSERLANLQALWDSQTVAELGPCGENEFKCSNIKEGWNCSVRKFNSILSRSL